MDGAMIHYETRDAVAVVTIDRPERRNALDRDALEGLERALERVADDSCRAVVLRGSAGHFCAGADLGGVEDTEFVAALRRVLVGLHSLPVPAIAGVEGAALGAGTQLAVACDLRVATEDALFGIPAAKLGLMVDQWTVDRLIRVAGESPARAMLLSAEIYRGHDAHRMGMVHRLGTPDDAVAWGAEIAALAPLTIVGHKLGLNGASDTAYADAFERAWSSTDLLEGIAAFRERRPPSFRAE
jgi:enoyl-CoA hydratase